MKLSIVLLSVFSLFAFSACKKEVTEINQVKQAYSAVYTIQPSAWKLSSDKSNVSVTLNVPEIDDYMNKNGGVLVYLKFNGKDYEALPETYSGLTYTVTHNVGVVNIIVYGAYDELINPNKLPNIDIQAKVVLIDADPLD